METAGYIRDETGLLAHYRAELETRERNECESEFAVKAHMQEYDQALANELRHAFDAGFQLAAKVEQRNAREAVDRILPELARLLGKDRGDGVIRFETFAPSEGVIRCAHAYLSEGDICTPCGKVI